MVQNYMAMRGKGSESDMEIVKRLAPIRILALAIDCQ